MKKYNVVLESSVEPKDKNVLWLHGKKLKKFGKTGWEDIGDEALIEDGAVTSEKISSSAFCKWKDCSC